GGIAHDVGDVHVHRLARTGHHLDQAFHPGRTVPGDRAEVSEFADLVGDEGEGGGCVLADDDRRACGILVDHHVMLGALAIDEVDLHQLSLMDHEGRVDLAVYIAADADIDHASGRDAGPECEDRGA